MATINYKEKYEKAVQAAMLAKQNTESAVTIGILEEIFPELVESEDERIRKALINGFNKLDKSAVWYNGITNGQILAWLERQGKNNMGISEATKQELEDNLNKALEKETSESLNKFLDEQGESSIKWNKNTEGNKPQVNHSVLMKTTHGIAEGEWQGEYWHQYRWAGIVRDSDVLSWVELSDLEKQGEQKPADKVEPSIFKDRLLELFQIFRWRCKDHILTNGEILEYVDAHIQELIGTMQKPADTEKGAKGNDREIPNSTWSEEDEDNFKHLMDEIVCLSNSRNSANRLYYDKLIKFLDELKNRAQPREEWRDKDKRMLDRLIAYFEKQVAFTDDDNPRYANWLKSLKDRYTWKPSDEQIKVCKEVYADILSAKGFDLGTVNSELNRMEEELKKLR